MYRVLVVDDEKIEREGIKFLLSREEGEFEISEASNGRQALEILRNEERIVSQIRLYHARGACVSYRLRAEICRLRLSGAYCRRRVRIHHFNGAWLYRGKHRQN